MASVSLTSGMRQNLLALQQTSVLQETTQNRLATGKKVNSALDNPTSYFTALAHTNRANDLLAYKDGISEAIQTIKAADVAITSLTKLVNSAKAVAEDAKGALTAGTGSTSQVLTINTVTGISAGTTINIGGTTFTAVASGATAATNFNIGSTTDAMAVGLASAINQATETRAMSATVSGSKITITAAANTMIAADIEYTAALSLAYGESAVGASSDLTSKVSQYSTLMSQIDDLKNDADYKGKNLLGGASGGTYDMTVRFGNSHTLTVASFDGSRSGLGIDASLTTTSEATLQSSIDKLDTAIATLRTNASSFATNLATVNTRDEWISNIAETLKTGADKLTLADANEEGASMLMLQTRQSLSTSALSMSAQAAQSVLRLFQ